MSSSLPKTEYAKSGDIHIAYQIFGKGPINLILAPGWVSNIEIAWKYPAYAHLLQRLASFSRVAWFDKRGTGLSDREVGLPTLEQRMDDVRAVMDAAGLDYAAIFGISEGGSMSALFAATHPGRTRALVLYGAFAKRVWSSDYPWAPKPEDRQKWLDSLEKGWGDAVELETIAPSVAQDEGFRKWFATYGRLSASPAAAVALGKMNTGIDIRDILPSIHVPTLVLHRRGDRDVAVGNGRFLAQNIPHAKFVQLPGDDHIPWVGDVDSITDEVEEFLTGVRPVEHTNRVLTTILFTDIVESTKRAYELGDEKWGRLVSEHNSLVRDELSSYNGNEVKATGDGFLARFDGPARAVRCACAIRNSVRQLGVPIRAGLHTGECELLGDDVGGLGVHIAARVVEKARESQVLVSSTVKDLVSGSGIQFKDSGLYMLKGVPGRWRLFQVDCPA